MQVESILCLVLSIGHVHCTIFLTVVYICFALFGNLRNFKIALRILSIAKLNAQFQNCVPSTQFGNRINYMFSAF